MVICTEVLEHTHDWRTAISNMKRLVKPEGLLLVTTRSKGFPYHGHPNDYWRYEITDMRKIFSDFTILSLKGDAEEPGVLLRVKKPKSWVPKDSTQIKLFSVKPLHIICVFIGSEKITITLPFYSKLLHGVFEKLIFPMVKHSLAREVSSS